jgi:ubiquinone/menaquinone biosynthesis C-methylase UbiE
MESRAATWPQIATWYDELLRGGSGPHELAVATLLRLVPGLTGSRVLDLACGQGHATRALARAGAASVTGVDITAELIDIARREEAAEPLGIRYLVDDAHALRSLADAGFDVVTCQLALMDIPGLAAALTATARVLRPGGTLVFVIGHPCFLAPDAATVRAPDGRPGRLVSRYLREEFWRSANPTGVRRVGNYHRPLSTYLNTLGDCGFLLDRVEEPAAFGRLASDQPVYTEVPIFLAARAVRR